MSLILVTLLMIGPSAGPTYQLYVENNPEKVAPYGEECPLCGEYGYCSKPPTHDEVVAALEAHFGKQGLSVVILKPRDRFLEVGVYRNGKLVDRVLLDLKTGRIRSIY